MRARRSILLVLAGFLALPIASALLAEDVLLRGEMDLLLDRPVLWIEPGAVATFEASVVRGTFFGIETVEADVNGDRYWVVTRRWSEPVERREATFELRARELAALASPRAEAHPTVLRVANAERDRDLWIRADTDPEPGLADPYAAAAKAGALEFLAPPAIAGDKATLLVREGSLAGALAFDVGRRPAGGASGAYNTTFLLLDLVGFVVHAPEAVVTADHLVADVRGTARFPAATGWLAEAGGWKLHEEALALEGDFRVEAFAAHAPRAELSLLGDDAPRTPTYAVSGSFRAIDVGGRPLLRVEEAAVATGGAALLAFALWLYSRVAARDILAHPARARVMALVLAEPGVSQDAIRERLGLSRANARWHIRVLASGRRVRVVASGHARLLYPLAVAADPVALAAARGKALDVYDHVALHPNSTSPVIASALGLDRQLVEHHLRTLVRLGLVRREEGRPARWTAAIARSAEAPPIETPA